MLWSDIPGWSCPRLLELYDELAAELRSGIFVEVGVAYGRSLAYAATKFAPEVQILGVDSWLVKMGRNTPDVWAKVKWDGTAWDAVNRFLFSGANPPGGRYRDGEATGKVELCQGNSVDVAYALDFEVDAVFLDGSHEYDAVKRDIQAWLPRVKSGGVLAGHDINDHYPGVARAVRELLPGAEERPPHPSENGWGGVWKWRKP